MSNKVDETDETAEAPSHSTRVAEYQRILSADFDRAQERTQEVINGEQELYSSFSYVAVLQRQLVALRTTTQRQEKRIHALTLEVRDARATTLAPFLALAEALELEVELAVDPSPVFLAESLAVAFADLRAFAYSLRGSLPVKAEARGAESVLGAGADESTDFSAEGASPSSENTILLDLQPTDFPLDAREFVQGKIQEYLKISPPPEVVSHLTDPQWSGWFQWQYITPKAPLTPDEYYIKAQKGLGAVHYWAWGVFSLTTGKLVHQGEVLPCEKYLALSYAFLAKCKLEWLYEQNQKNTAAAAAWEKEFYSLPPELLKGGRSDEPSA